MPQHVFKALSRHSALSLVCVLFATSGCECEDRIRKALSDPGRRGRDLGMPKDDGLIKEPSSSEPEEQEPNNIRPDATRYELGKELRDMRAMIASSGDEDWYLIGVVRDEMLEVRVTPLDEDLNLTVELSSSDDTPLIYEVSGAGEPEIIPWLIIAGGEARALKVKSESGQGRYRLGFKRHLSAGLLEAEPNDIWGDATKLGGKAEIQGFYDRPGDLDRFAVSGTQSVRSIAVAGVKGISQRLKIVRDEQDVFEWVSARGEGIRVPNLGGEALQFELSTLGDMYSRQEPYHVRISEPVTQDGALLELEPNNPEVAQLPDLPYATPTAEPMKILGYLHDAQDVDVFRLGVKPGGVLRYTITSALPGVWIKHGEASVSVPQRIERCVAATTDVVELWVGGKQGSADSPAYTLEVWLEDASQGKGEEPNDAMNQATELRGAGPWEGRLLKDGDRDWYAFEVLDEGMYAIGTMAHELDMKWGLRDDEGGVIANAQSAGAGGKESLEMVLPQGKYFVEVSALKGSSCEPYSLYVNKK